MIRKSFDAPPDGSKPIADFPAYVAAPDGFIWSSHVNSYLYRGMRAPWHRLAARPNPSGRPDVKLINGPNERRFKLAVVVLSAFAGPAPESGMVPCHKDGDLTNTRPDNLFWSYPHDPSRCTVDKPSRHVDPALREEAVKMLNRGVSQIAVARKLGISASHVNRIANGWTRSDRMVRKSYRYTPGSEI
jgi:hypothetical protein